MKRICTVVLSLLMLGVTCSFAQRLDKEPSLPPIPSLQGKPAPYLDGYEKFLPRKQAPNPTQEDRDNFNKAEARLRAEVAKAERAKRAELLKAVGGHKKLVPLYEDFQARYDWSVAFSSNGVEFGIETVLNSPPDRIIFKTTSPVLVVQENFEKHTIVFDKNGKNIFEWKGNYVSIPKKSLLYEQIHGEEWKGDGVRVIVRVFRDKKGKVTKLSTEL